MDDNRDRRRREIETECRRNIVDACNMAGGVLEAGKGVKLEGDVKTRYEKACDEASKFADKNGKTDPAIQTIFACMYGLI